MSGESQAQVGQGEGGAAPTFEEAYQRLEKIVRQLESAPVGLTEALRLYEEGIGSLKSCYRILEQVERRIEMLTSVGPGGEAQTVPFDEATVPMEEKVGRRTRRKSTAPGTPERGTTAGDSDPIDAGGTLF